MSVNEETVTVEIDGRAIVAAKGEMLIAAADRAGIYIPRFCYHPHLSVVANCRMCLVEIERAPKPMPACATPVADGMKVATRSKSALNGQRGVMEFLLINHPLDCPICDQGGECELQDLAMGFGRGVSRFSEGKRAVEDEDLGPLVATEMTRCIHCTRCVRFLDEIAGQKELGSMARGEQTRISTYNATGLHSELSANIVDLCPVGALTNKPYRFRARPWELLSFPAVAPHDGVGSNLELHTLRGRVVRAVPAENPQINETWIADRDRFGIEGLAAADRLLQPQIKEHGGWREASWEEALERAADGLRTLVERHGGSAIGGLLAPTATLEELYLAARLLRGLGCNNIDHRLREVDTSDQHLAPPFPYLGQPIEELERADAVLLLGSYSRHEQPLIHHRLRKAALAGATVVAINPRRFEWNLPLTREHVVSVDAWVGEMAALAKVLGESAGRKLPKSLAALAAPESAAIREMAQRLKAAERPTVLLGNLATSHPQAAVLRALGALVGQWSGGRFGIMAEAANTVGGWLAGAVPHRGVAGQAVEVGGLAADAMLRAGLRGFLLLNVEPERDLWDPQAAHSALQAAEHVVAVTPFADERLRAHADVLLPSAAFAETAGTWVNTEGRWQSVRGVAKPLGAARPGWRVLRALATVLELEGFEYEDIAGVYAELAGMCRAVRPAAVSAPEALAEVARWTPKGKELVLCGGVPIYAGDPLVRRSQPLQESSLAGQLELTLAPQTAQRLGLLAAGGEPLRARVRSASGAVELPIVVDEAVPPGTAWIPAGLDGRAPLGPTFGTVTVEAI